jgi:perosamine synthetase
MIGPIQPFDAVGYDEYALTARLLYDGHTLPLSGYLAGQQRGGHYVRKLEDEWAEMFGVKHAIACNSATSGLLAASFAVGLKAGDTFVCPAMTMSATAAAPMFTGATPTFQDVTDVDFGLQIKAMPETTKAIFTTNLFGHPSSLACNQWSTGSVKPVYLIEDNSQSPFAMCPNDRYAGTNGTIGVWSLNVHKHIQCGEGGVITTDDDALATFMRNFINHGENSTMGFPIGLNLRLPELCAAVALSQLRRGLWIMEERVEQALEILHAIGDIPGIRRPVVRDGCRHVYYVIPFLFDRPDVRVGTANCDMNPVAAGPREMFCDRLRAAGVPIVEGYQRPLYRLPAFMKYRQPCPVAADLNDNRLFYFENCAWSPTEEQIKLIGEAFKRAAEGL